MYITSLTGQAHPIIFATLLKTVGADLQSVLTFCILYVQTYSFSYFLMMYVFVLAALSYILFPPESYFVKKSLIGFCIKKRRI